MRLTCSAACAAVNAAIPAMRLPRPRLLLDLAPAVAAGRFPSLQRLEIDVIGEPPAGAPADPPFLRPAAASALAQMGQRLTALEFDDARGGAEDSDGALVPFLMATVELRGLRLLKVMGPSPSAAGVAAAVHAATFLPVLEEFYLCSSADAAEAAGAVLQEAFSRRRPWAHLKVLEMPAPTAAGLRALAAAQLPSLRSLRLAHGPSDGDASDANHHIAPSAAAAGGGGGPWAAALAGAVWLAQLQKLDLVSCGGLNQDGLTALAGAPLHNLEALLISDPSELVDFDVVARALSHAPLPALRSLDLGTPFEQSGLLTRPGLEALASCPWLPQLTRLSLCRNVWSRPETWGAFGELRLPRLRQLTVLVEGHDVALLAAAKLADAPVFQSVSSLRMFVRCPANNGVRFADGRTEREKLLRLPGFARLGRNADIYVLT